MTPVAPADHFLAQGAVFQSAEGSSASTTIEIAFSRSVRNVTVTMFDPTWQGNHAIASTRAGTNQTINFAFNNTPGVALVDSKTFTVLDIRNIALIPADTDYVAYSLTFDPDTLPCPPTGDPILDSANVRTPLTDQWTASKAEGLERGGWIYENLSAPGTYFIQQDLAGYRSLCRYTVREPFPLADSRPVAYWHTHIVDWGTLTDPCPDNPPGTRGSFGLSPQDISEMNTKVFPDGNKYPTYMVGEDFVFRAKPGETNGKGWQWSTANRCR